MPPGRLRFQAVQDHLKKKQGGVFARRRTVKEYFKLTGLLAYWWAVLIVLVILGSLIWLAFAPTYNNLAIKQFRTTNQYQSSKEQLLFKLVAEYEELAAENKPITIGQREALVDRIHFEADMLKDAGGTIPTPIVAFLEAHK